MKAIKAKQTMQTVLLRMSRRGTNRKKASENPGQLRKKKCTDNARWAKITQPMLFLTTRDSFVNHTLYTAVPETLEKLLLSTATQPHSG